MRSEVLLLGYGAVCLCMMAQQRGEESGEFSPELKEYYRVIQPVILYLAMVYREL